ncbi:Eukaryotic-type carbonic anhydrase [Phytophthora infestans]|uniref:carbonic anhydrase n=1 Tax=Phytophthora infestans TaxID=4787 RepID=A0A8S9V2E9_PHYIN|nr:Eukaryotic-type carbonic anhydrase [Phytophthora infestans]KAF4146237.1 Eukaryotic-type carbonic anhydrase [Phytophthora infestans]
MKFFATASAIIVACTLTKATVSATPSGGAPWGYRTDDPTMTGPTQWGTLAGVFGSCSLTLPLRREQMWLRARCRSVANVLTHTDNTFKASVLNAKGAVYKMAQLHLHAPSEHTLNGKPLNGEVHFVHTNADGSALMVVGVFLDVVNRGVKLLDQH